MQKPHFTLEKKTVFFTSKKILFTSKKNSFWEKNLPQKKIQF